MSENETRRLFGAAAAENETPAVVQNEIVTEGNTEADEAPFETDEEVQNTEVMTEAAEAQPEATTEVEATQKDAGPTEAEPTEAHQAEETVAESDDSAAASRADDTVETLPEENIPAAGSEETAPAQLSSEQVFDNEMKSVGALNNQRDIAQATVDAHVDTQKQSVLNQIVAVVKAYQLTNEEVITALGGLKSKRKGVPAKPKYRNPADGKTWSGRGKEPLWIKGQDRNAFLITE